MYCKHCGAELDDEMKFCNKCGAPTEDAPPPKKPVDLSFFSKHFWMFFIVSGVCAYLLIEIAAAYTAFSAAFTVVLGVLALVAALCFLAIGIIGKIVCVKLPDEEKQKKSIVYNICLAVSIIIFVFVLLLSIALFMTAAEVSDLNDLMNGLGGIFGN